MIVPAALFKRRAALQCEVRRAKLKDMDAVLPLTKAMVVRSQFEGIYAHTRRGNP